MTPGPSTPVPAARSSATPTASPLPAGVADTPPPAPCQPVPTTSYSAQARPPATSLLGLALAVLACAPAPAPPPARPTPDKRALYGDPALVPTRRGESARDELARAGEIERLLAVDPRLAEIRVHIASRGAGPPEVAIGARVVGDAPVDEAAIASLARAVLGAPEAPVLVHALPAVAAPPPAERPNLPLALALALVGLGASAGITLDRLARRRRARRRR